MLRRSLCLIALLVFVTALAGCLVTQDTYVKKQDEANTLAKNVAELDQKNKEIAAQIERLQAENNDLKKQIAVKDALLQKNTEEIAKQEAKQAEMVNEMDRMKAQLAISREVTIEESPAAKKQAGLKSLRIKVLSGDGKIDSARQMAKRISSMGYEVGSVEIADHSDYPVIIVYFAPKYKKEAKTLAAKLGKETAVKPLYWKSVFNLIVVTGG
jgi:predicted RNase H-like nuclease (RuvC/YqgF family)